jgi:hypothetical protein
VEPEETSVTWQRLGKHIPMATNAHATIEEPLEAVFYMVYANVKQDDSILLSGFW